MIVRRISIVGLLSTAWIGTAITGGVGVVLAQPIRPNIVLVMADDMGHSQTGYRNHPLLATPNLDALAAGGLRLDRFYAASAVCSPTRASVLTGRHPVRCGVPSHGHALRHQESTVIQTLAAAGYATGHFGKWHLDGLRGPGVPIFREDPFHPGRFGFQQWLSVTNYFDRDPLMSRMGDFESFTGDSSEIIVEEAVQFMRQTASTGQPFAAVIWFGTPHSPFRADAADLASLARDDPAKRALLDSMDDASRQHYGELVAMDRALGTLRRGLGDLGQLDDTLIWFCSDNGGLPKITPSPTSPLRGHKGTLFEGGIRVPCVVHWPARIAAGRISQRPSVTSDISPTVLDLLGLDAATLTTPVDGVSLKEHLFAPESSDASDANSSRPIGFLYAQADAVVDGRWKLLRGERGLRQAALFDLESDPGETTDVAAENPEVADRLTAWLDSWNSSVQASESGTDYPTGTVDADHPEPRPWTDVPEYQAMFDEWSLRPEYRGWIGKLNKPPGKKTTGKKPSRNPTPANP